LLHISYVSMLTGHKESSRIGPKGSILGTTGAYRWVVLKLEGNQQPEENPLPSETRLINAKNEPTSNILGPEIQFLVDPAEAAGAFGLVRGVVAPAIAVPLHSHADPEVMFVLDGALEFLQHDGKSGRWLTARRGEFISIPGNATHALRNSTHENTSLLLVTTPNIYGFFRAIANPVNSGSKPGPLTPTDMERLMALSVKHNYWLASPEENAAIGLDDFSTSPEK
jgi:quercetin dioxygenase-like cupin family protein